MTHGALVKCVVWDLDETCWSGVLLEGGAGELRPGVRAALDTLDGRGVLHAIASRNDPEAAQARLRDLGVAELFVAAEIGWGAKSVAVSRLAERLNVALENMVFIDDQPFERDEVAAAHPQVRTVDARDVAGLPELAGIPVGPASAEAASRRLLYLAAAARDAAEACHEGSPEAFLRTLDLRLQIRDAEQGDLPRLSELTVRTTQLNANGRVYSETDLANLMRSDEHRVLVAELSDCYGDYGLVGLAVLATPAEAWRLELLLVSCRVMSRGVGPALLGHLCRAAQDANVPLSADFRSNGRNRPMYVALRLAGFQGPAGDGEAVSLMHDPARTPGPLSYLLIAAATAE